MSPSPTSLRDSHDALRVHNDCEASTREAVGKGRFEEAAVQKILASALTNVRSFAAMGGLLAPGTDAGAWAVPHGSLTEYALFEEALGTDAGTALEKGIAEIVRKF